MKQKLNPLKVKILERNLSQKQLAQTLQLNPGTLSLIISGQQVPKPVLQKRIAEVLNCETEEIFIS